MIFNPTRSRETIDGEIARVLRAEYRRDALIGNWASNHLQSVIEAWLVGCQAEARPIIPRSMEWLRRAIEADEQAGDNHNFHRMTLRWANAIGTWMELGWDAEGDWNDARIFEEAAWRFEKRPWPTNEIIRNGLDDYMAFCVQAGEYEAGIQMYEHWVGVKKLSITKALKPREYGYALCLHHGRGEFEDAALFEAGRRLLSANLEENWLGAGQAIRAATWLKIVYWDREDRDLALTPLRTVLKAYENMPNVPLPNFVKLDAE